MWVWMAGRIEDRFPTVLPRVGVQTVMKTMDGRWRTVSRRAPTSSIVVPTVPTRRQIADDLKRGDHNVQE
jgi:hypothetical protein